MALFEICLLSLGAREGAVVKLYVCIYLRRKKDKTPAEMKPFLHPDSSICLKKGLVKIFSLTSPDGKPIVVE